MNSDILITESAFSSPECVLNIIDIPLVFNCIRGINLQLILSLYFSLKYIFLSLAYIFIEFQRNNEYVLLLNFCVNSYVHRIVFISISKLIVQSHNMIKIKM